uniref:Uncharacterized protein n=1 Tax=Oryza sativa subsp. japonica TaxID=39947 RepID=Q5WMQ2_ORYSJ|nr:hypothetical protein [Oryza sativa Japonica Group]
MSASTAQAPEPPGASNGRSHLEHGMGRLRCGRLLEGLRRGRAAATCPAPGGQRPRPSLSTAWVTDAATSSRAWGSSGVAGSWRRRRRMMEQLRQVGEAIGGVNALLAHAYALAFHAVAAVEVMAAAKRDGEVGDAVKEREKGGALGGLMGTLASDSGSQAAARGEANPLAESAAASYALAAASAESQLPPLPPTPPHRHRSRSAARSALMATAFCERRAGSSSLSPPRSRSRRVEGKTKGGAISSRPRRSRDGSRTTAAALGGWGGGQGGSRDGMGKGGEREERGGGTHTRWPAVLAGQLWLRTADAVEDTITASRPLSGNQKLVSRGEKFALGFFRSEACKSTSSTSSAIAPLSSLSGNSRSVIRSFLTSAEVRPKLVRHSVGDGIADSARHGGKGRSHLLGRATTNITHKLVSAIEDLEDASDVVPLGLAAVRVVPPAMSTAVVVVVAALG